MNKGQCTMDVHSTSSTYPEEGAPASYKQTEMGVIPEDWGVSVLKDCCSKITDGTHDTPKPVPSGIPFLTAIHVKDNWIDFESCLYVIEADHAVIYSRCNPNKNDVLMVNIGAGVATTALVDVDYEFSLKNVALLKPDSRTVGAYLNYSLAQRKPKIIQDLSSGGAQPFLSLMQICEIAVALPPTKAEQEAIAEALSDVDKLLGSLEKLIAKKQAIKQAAMQQLLTGKTRLPGFGGEWETTTLGELAVLYQPVTISATQLTEAGFPVYGANGVIGFYSESNHNTWQVIVTCRGSTCGTVNRTVGRCWVTGNAMVLNCDHNKALNKDFFYYLLCNQDLSACITGTGQPQIVRGPLAAFGVALPPSIAEQTAIATVLSDMDTEIVALQQRRDKTRAIRQGMMQQLLTGRVRLVSTREGNGHAP